VKPRERGRFEVLPRLLLGAAGLLVVCTPSGVPQGSSPDAAIQARPADLVLGLADFPLDGYRIASDRAMDSTTWERAFSPIARPAAGPFYVVVTLSVLPSSIDMASYFSRSICALAPSPSDAPSPMSRSEVSSPRIGDRARACYLEYEFDDFGTHVSSRVIDYVYTTRNVQVRLQVSVEKSADQSAALDVTLQLARTQLAKIDGPRTNAAATNATPLRTWVPPTAPAGFYVVSGTVTDDAGRPAGDVAVTRLCRTLNDPACPPSVTTTTDAEGHYALVVRAGTFAVLFVDARSLRGAGPARYEARAWNSPADARASDAATVTVPPSRTGIDVVLPRR
jgi:hypothetical protein